MGRFFPPPRRACRGKNSQAEVCCCLASSLTPQVPRRLSITPTRIITGAAPLTVRPPSIKPRAVTRKKQDLGCVVVVVCPVPPALLPLCRWVGWEVGPRREGLSNLGKNLDRRGGAASDGSIPITHTTDARDPEQASHVARIIGSGCLRLRRRRRRGAAGAWVQQWRQHRRRPSPQPPPAAPLQQRQQQQRRARARLVPCGSDGSRGARARDGRRCQRPAATGPATAATAGRADHVPAAILPLGRLRRCVTGVVM